MRVGGRAGKLSLIMAVCLIMAAEAGYAQKKPVVATPDATRKVLIEKAHALEARGRPDMAIQSWQQILLSDPKNAEALAGMARDLKLVGSLDQSNAALEKLRKANPADPNIAKIAAMASTRAQSDKLRQAGELARKGKPDEAMRIYRELYGDRPPDGDIALAYYQTLYGTTSGKETAISAMRALALRNPGDTRFEVELGIMLTYEPKTRAEGIRLLEAHPRDSNSQTALRQALVWDAANPASAALLRQYLKDHPQDTEMGKYLKEDEAKLSQMNSGIARTPAERAAFAALNAHHLEEAQSRFTEILASEPNNGRVAAGMGFLRMQQNNFGAAISYLSQAEQNGYKDRAVVNALVTSRFWAIMAEASQAFDENQFDVAAADYKTALGIRPRAPEALNGLAGLLVKEQQYGAAAGVYEQLIKAQPGSAAAWRGLFLCYAREGSNQKALALMGRLPGGVRGTLAKDPEYLRTLATLYRAANRPADAQRVLALALALPFPNDGSNLKTDTRLQYAGILLEAKRYAQAVEIYVQVLNEDATNQPAWMGLVSAHHEMGQDTLALSDIQKMPPAVYDATLTDPGFLSMLGGIYQQANQYEVAQGLLERSAKIEIASGGQPSIALQLQMAAIDMQRNDTAQAYAIYHRVLQAHPDRVDAWKGLIASLQVTNRNSEAIQEIAQIPVAVRRQLESDVEFVQGEASLYAVTGNLSRAVECMVRVQAHYRDTKTLPPPNVDVQSAWLLYNTGNDRALYPTLMRLGGRKDLTVAQREAVQEIWANWSVRRAGAAMDNGNVTRAVEILDAAGQAFPDNLAVRKAVAGGYVRVGRAKESLALFKTIPMQDATSGDFQGAIGAALAANDRAEAEIWLRQALDRYPRSPAILSLAARYEQARGDNQRAADYYRASLAAMPLASPADRLAHTLVYPDQDLKAHRAVTAADLQNLLDPNYEPFAKTTKLAPLPAYGADPYDGSAPVVLAPAHPSRTIAPQDAPTVNVPNNDSEEMTPSAQSPDQRLFRQQSVTRFVGGNARLRHKASARPRMLFATLQFTTTPRMRARGLYRGYFLRAGLTGQIALPRRVHASLGQAQGQTQAQEKVEQPIAGIPHSLASDAWKGLVFSLMAAKRNAEALQEVQKIPPDVRKLLESDVEFEQGMASLYVAVGDNVRAMDYLNRVDDFYLLRRTPVPIGMEVQHAWLLYNVKDDHGLYPVLNRLDGRQDLSTAQRSEVEELWASWAVRRAMAAMDGGYVLRGVQILQAASEQYPDNLTIRRAVAGAYLKVGRATDSLALYKTISMDEASSGDYQGAIGAALAASDLAQAEAWLRKALDLFPNDPQIMGEAARFEQARGNNQRAADFWRAALSFLPPGSAIQGLENGLVYPPGAYQPPAPGDLKRLLDPRNDPTARSPKLPPLPSYAADSYRRSSSSAVTPQQYQAPQQTTTPRQNQWVSPPSTNPLPQPPITNYGPQSSVPRLPVMIEQSATREADILTASNSTPGTQPKSKPAPNSSTAYMGKMNLPKPVNRGNGAQAGDAQSQPGQVWTPQMTSRDTSSSAGLRITAQPLDPAAARAQALFAEQTDGQLTEDSASNIRMLANTPLPQPNLPGSAAPEQAQYNETQYTPSAQEAATGAFSAPRQNNAQAQQPPSELPLPQAQPAPAAPKRTAGHTTRKARKAARRAAATETATEYQARPQTLGAAPLPPPLTEVQIQAAELPASQVPATTTTGLSDQELEQRNLPPLRGPWVRVQREQRALTPRDEAEMQLRSIESGYSGWLGGAGVLNYRSGDLGFDHLTALEAPFEASMPLGYSGRLTFVARPVFLDSGQATGTSVITVQASPVDSGVAMTQISIPQPLGTLMATDSTIPSQQNASGLGGEVQLAFPHFAIAGGYTPAGFLVATFTARLLWKPGNGPFTFSFNRDSVKDTQLSYSGLRNPLGNTLGNQGQVWGGVVANQFNAQYAHGDAESGFYMSAGGQYLTGYGVQDNTRIDGSGGAYWRLKTMPEYGNLSIGVNFFGMHYDKNEDAFTMGMGGYFSPQAYFLANVPFTWAGHYETRWHYNIMGSLGVQAFQEDATPLFPLASSNAYNVTLGSVTYTDLQLPDKTSVGPNYDLRAQVAYQISPHWFAGGFFGANNSRNYKSATAGFYVRYLFRSQPSTVTSPTGIFSTDGMRPFTVP